MTTALSNMDGEVAEVKKVLPPLRGGSKRERALKNLPDSTYHGKQRWGNLGDSVIVFPFQRGTAGGDISLIKIQKHLTATTERCLRF
jgi:hypothetical protein